MWQELVSSNGVTSWILLGVASLIIYTLVLAPNAAGTGVRAMGAPQQQDLIDRVRGGTPSQPRHNQNSSTNSRIPCSRSPDHLMTPPHNNGSNVLNDGLIAFCHTHASLSSNDEDESRRRRRVQLLSRLMDASTMRPPSKGSTVSIAIDDRHLDCHYLHEAIQLFASYYNVLVIVAVSSSSSDDDNDFSKLQSTALPKHRILAASTIAGRVAIVRQLQRVELVLEIDTAAQDLLARFGHKVIVYGQDTTTATTTSRFAQLWNETTT